MTIIYHNPRCSKSRQALALIRERGIEPSIELYLETPPSAAALAALLALARGAAPETALQWGVAAASATVSTDATALCDLAQAQACFDLCQLEQL